MPPPTSPLDTLRDAAALLAAGQATRARALLGELVRAQPDHAEAQRLLGAALMQTGDVVRAQKALRACLRLRPGDPDTPVQLARALAASGQQAEAVQVLRDALQRDPGNLAATCALARTLLLRGQPEQVLRLMEPLAGRNPLPGEFLMLYGHALQLCGRASDAVRACRQWTRDEPDNPMARLRLAGALVDSGEFTEGEACVRAASPRLPGSPEAAFVLGRALMGQGRAEEAEVQLRGVVRAQPEHVVAQNNLAELVWMRTGDAVAAAAELDAAIRARPRLMALRAAKARLLASARQPDAALAEVDAGLARTEGAPELLAAGAMIALEVDGARALEYARRALRVAPGDRAARVAFGNASLAVGHAREALRVAADLQRADSTDGQAHAMRADALRMLGDQACRELLDYAGLVRAALLDVPDGWPDLPAYLADLVACLDRAHTFSAHPIGNSLREGSQVELQPERSQEPAIRAFPQAIDGPIRAYLGALGRGHDPTRGRNTGRYGLSGMWSVRLRPGGYHANHYHPRGWISSACYLRLPAAVGTRGGEGWLKFGEPAFPTRPALGPEYFIRPEPGLLALFPSYMWHGTVPFSGAEGETRLTIAFDVVPGK